MVHFIKMNESHPCDAFLHFAVEYSPFVHSTGLSCHLGKPDKISPEVTLRMEVYSLSANVLLP